MFNRDEIFVVFISSGLNCRSYRRSLPRWNLSVFCLTGAHFTGVLCLTVPISAIQNPQSKPSVFCNPSSVLRTPTSDLRHLSSELRPLPSDLWSLASDLRPPTSDLRPLSPIFFNIRCSMLDVRCSSFQPSVLWITKSLNSFIPESYSICPEWRPDPYVFTAVSPSTLLFTNI